MCVCVWKTYNDGKESLFQIFLLFQQFPSASNHALHCFRTLTRAWRPFQWLQLMSSNRCRVRTDERWLRRYQVDTNYDSRDADHLLFSWTGSPAEMTFCASLQMRYRRRSRRPWVGVRSPSEATLWQAPQPDPITLRRKRSTAGLMRGQSPRRIQPYTYTEAPAKIETIVN